MDFSPFSTALVGFGGSIRPAWPDRHEIGRTAALAFARLDQGADAARAGGARARWAAGSGFDPCIAGCGVDHDPLAVNDALALTDDDVAA
jgi:hypothetical protein